MGRIEKVNMFENWDQTLYVDQSGDKINFLKESALQEYLKTAQAKPADTEKVQGESISGYVKKHFKKDVNSYFSEELNHKFDGHCLPVYDSPDDPRSNCNGNGHLVYKKGEVKEGHEFAEHTLECE